MSARLARLTSSAYTIVESTTHSIAVDILTSPSANIGTLFVSSGEGTYFVEALADTNRNEYGIVDFEQLVGLEVSKTEYFMLMSGGWCCQHRVEPRRGRWLGRAEKDQKRDHL